VLSVIGPAGSAAVKSGAFMMKEKARGLGASAPGSLKRCEPEAPALSAR